MDIVDVLFSLHNTTPHLGDIQDFNDRLYGTGPKTPFEKYELPTIYLKKGKIGFYPLSYPNYKNDLKLNKTLFDLEKTYERMSINDEKYIKEKRLFVEEFDLLNEILLDLKQQVEKIEDLDKITMEYDAELRGLKTKSFRNSVELENLKKENVFWKKMCFSTTIIIFAINFYNFNYLL